MARRRSLTALATPTSAGGQSGFTWAALAWATGVFILHLRYYSKNIPVSFTLYCRQLQTQLVLGPNFTHFWSGHLLRTGGCLLLFMGAWAVGDIALRWFLRGGDEDEFAPLDLVFALGLGLGILGYGAFALLALGIAHRGLLVGLYALLCLAGIARCTVASLAAPEVRAAKGTVSPPTWSERMFGVFVFLALAIAFLGTTTPEISYDALVYHLAVPQSYLFAGRLVDMPYNHFSYLPLFASLLYFWGLAIGGMFFAKLINFSLGLCVLLGLHRWGTVTKERAAGLLACAIFLGTPLISYLFVMTNADLGTAFYFLLALMATWRWRQAPEKGCGMLALAGLFAGISLAAKYTAAFGIGALTLLIAWRCWTNRKTLRPRTFLLYGVFLALPLIPWWARNYAYTGNPAYPYLVGRWGPKGTDMDLLRLWYKETRDECPGAHPLSHARKLWNDAISGIDRLPFNYIGPLFVGFLFLIFRVFKIPWARWTTILCCASIMSGLCGTYITRLLICYFVPLMLVVAYSITSLPAKTAQKGWALALLLGILSFNVAAISHALLLTVIEGLSVASGRVTPSEYLKQARLLYPNPTYGAYEFIRQKMEFSPAERILLVGDSRAFYSPGPVIANAPYDVPIIFAWAGADKDPEALFARLKSQDIRLVILNIAEGVRKESSRYIDQERLNTVSQMLDRHFDKVYSAGCLVFRRKA
jgi:hypothetical protein